MLIFINVKYITPTRKKYYVPILKKTILRRTLVVEKIYLARHKLDSLWVAEGVEKGQPRVKMRKNGAQTA